MSNGSSHVGEVRIEPRWHKFIGDCPGATVEVGDAWSDHDDTAVTLAMGPDGEAPAYLLNADEARQIAALLLQAAGNPDLAEAIPADMARRAEAARASEEARVKLRAAEAAASKAFLDATAEQRAAYNAAVDDAERAYGDTANARSYRQIDLAVTPVMPF